MEKKTPLTESSDWTFELIDAYYNEISRIAKDKFNLDTYPNQIEIISSEQMLDAYSSVGLPVNYNHWSFGKQFVREQEAYKRGHMNLAYEIVSNTSPCISYLMEENSMMMQILVMAHACFGHNAFFKNNYLFKQWTDAEAIVDYLMFAKKYIALCEEKYGISEVESVIDACHVLQRHGVDKYKRPSALSPIEEEARQAEREAYIQSQVNEIWNTLPEKNKDTEEIEEKRFPTESHENILYFIEKNSPNLPIWKREIIRIVRKLAQYFYPQGQTKLENEGYACVTGDTLIDTKNGLIRADEIVNSKYEKTVFDGNKNQKVVDWFFNPNKKRVKVITKAGFEIHGGTNHKILIGDNWVELQNLKVGQEISIVRGDNSWPTKLVKLPEYEVKTRLSRRDFCKQYGVNETMFQRWQTDGLISEKSKALCATINDEFEEIKHLPSKNTILTRIQPKFPSELTEDLAYWIGLMIGDGYIGTKGSKFVNLTNQDQQLLTFFEKFTKKTFGINCTLKPDRNHFNVKCHSNTVVEYLMDVFEFKGGYSAGIKTVPHKILLSPLPVVAAFLRGHFDTDGSTNKHGGIILVSKSKQLIIVEQQLLLKMGIVARVSKQNSDGCYRLIIGGIDTKLFFEKIGFGLKYKQKRLADWLKKKHWFPTKKDKTHITAIEYDEGPTYDFSVENSHQYKASCFINHNCYIHYHIMHELHKEGLITDGFMLEFYASHTGVVAQPSFDSKYYSGINPYALGFAMFQDIRRITVDPTEEDKAWFGDQWWVGCGDTNKTTDWAVRNFKDDSFVMQFLSPKVIRDFKFFAAEDKEKDPKIEILAIHEEQGYKKIREILSNQYNISNYIPDIQVYEVDRWGDRSLTLRHQMHNERPLDTKNTREVLKHIHQLWGFGVKLESVSKNGKILSMYVCDETGSYGNIFIDK